MKGMAMPKKTDALGSILDDIVEGFADIVDGSIFDFDGEDNDDTGSEDKRRSDATTTEPIPAGEGDDGKSKPAKPGKLAGVSITGNAPKKGATPGDKESPEGDDVKPDKPATGSGSKSKEPASKPD